MIAISIPLMLKPGMISIGRPSCPRYSAGYRVCPDQIVGEQRAQQDADRDRGQHAHGDRIAGQGAHDPEVGQGAQHRGAGQANNDGERQIAIRDHQALKKQKGAEDHQVAGRQVEHPGRAIDQHVSHAQQGIEARLNHDHQQEIHRPAPRLSRGP
jgi:hypothetical protein